MEVTDKEQIIQTEGIESSICTSYESLKASITQGKIEQDEIGRLSKMKKATITISRIKHNVLINGGNYIHGYRSDYILIGKIWENKHIIYILDGDKYNSYLTQGDETIEVYIDGTIGHISKNAVNIEHHEATMEEVANDDLDFLKVYMEYMQSNLPTLTKVLEEIDQLTTPSKDNPEQLVFDEVYRKYKESIIKLKKQIN